MIRYTYSPCNCFKKFVISFVNTEVGSTYVAQKSVTKIVIVTIMNLLTPKGGAKHELLFNEPASGPGALFTTLYFLCNLQIWPIS